MAHVFPSSPGTDRHDTTHFQQPDMSIEGSFQAPAGRDNLFSKPRTPRNPLAALRNPNAKTEFTPLMKSAATNRMRQVNGLTTPIGLKPGFKVGGTPLPEASTMDLHSSSFSESTSMAVPQAADSSEMSTPMALPRRAEGELENGNGNVITLREQEAVSLTVSPHVMR
jgi:hypothetical protein